jgi:hypothetical protein
MKKLTEAFLDHVTVHHVDMAVSVQLENDFDQFIRDTSDYFISQMGQIDREMKSEDIGYVEVPKENEQKQDDEEEV